MGDPTCTARVEPGIVIHSGIKVLPGKLVRTQAEADNPLLGKVALVTAADRTFMEGVIHVNENFAREYTRLFRRRGLNAVLGVGVNPGHNDFGNRRTVPVRNAAGRSRVHKSPAVLLIWNGIPLLLD